MKNFFRSPIVWISATVISGLLFLFSFHFFPKTFPLVHLDITMDLRQALEKAATIAQNNNYGPQDYHNAATFHTDTTTKTFVELEGGGKDAFVAMMESKLYAPYTWQVRHFKEFEKNEAIIRFTPEGTPYGFIETISENIPGSQLTQLDAQTIAEKNAVENWNIDLSLYTLVESTQKTQPSERIDHVFVYELVDQKIGEGLYRLKIQVSGDKVTELTHFIKIPEAFIRRYSEMRSANNIIAWGANIILMLLYIIGGCIFGLSFIIKKRWALWRQPLLWAGIMAFSTTLASLNQLPFFWMHYNTAHTFNGFLMQLCISFFTSLLMSIFFITMCITTAESLTRRAFGDQLQLWRIWSTDMASSYAVLGRTIGGYLCVGFNMAFVVLFYFISTRFFGWWNPSDTLFDPNILATYVPWFSPLALSLNAAFLEECLFRAIPLAGAALLGNRFGKRTLWITAALILQAIVFGAAHANYPAQPSYARLVELIIPSLIWGITYLRFGLLPTIITHFVYDVIWFSLPIFVSIAPYALLYKIIIVICTLLPLGIVLYKRIKNGKWNETTELDANKSWQPSPEKEKIDEPIMTTMHQPVSHKTVGMVVCLGIIGLIAWLWATPFSHDGITITISRGAAIKESNNFLAQQNIHLDAPWKTLPLVFTSYQIPPLNMQHKFIWQKGDKNLYHSLLGTYLEPAHWTIRYAQFDGDIINRAEEHKVFLFNNTIWRHSHQLPESSLGKQLTQEQARPIAHHALTEKFNLDPLTLKEISAQEIQHPNRKDWLFTFSDPAVNAAEKGQARINILIAGDTMIDVARMIHVPEEWERNETANLQIINIINLGCILLFLLWFLLVTMIAFKQSAEYLFSRKLFFTFFSLISGISIINMINAWQSSVAAFNTTEPFINQSIRLITSSLLFGNLIMSALIAALAVFVIGQKERHAIARNYSTLLLGICGGTFFAGAYAFINKMVPALQPLWPDYTPLLGSIPVITSVTATIMQYFYTTITIWLLYIIVNRVTREWQRNRFLVGILFILLGLITTNLTSLTALPLWCGMGIIKGCLLFVVYRFLIVTFNSSIIPLATGVFTLLPVIQQGLFNAYPGALLAEGINIVIIVFLSTLLFTIKTRYTQQ